MKDKRRIVSMVIAAVIALGVVVVSRLLVSGEKVVETSHQQGNIPMPNIPLMVKETKKIEEVNVLVASKKINRGEKIGTNVLTWKKWPKDIVQSNFIAKDSSGNPLNNGGDYRLALTMWAGSDIVEGVPLTISMLLSFDPIKKEQEEKKKKDEEQAKKAKAQEVKKQAETSMNIIRKGMRAITFPIDQRSASSLAMMKAGDLVDVLINEPKDGKIKTRKYKGIKILAIDGMTTSVKKTTKDQDLFGISNITNAFSTPKNVTLEIKESLVETMLKQSSSSGVILSLRNQADNKEVEAGDSNADDSGKVDTLFQKLSSASRMDSAQALIDAQTKKDEQHKTVDKFIQNMNMLARGGESLIGQYNSMRAKNGGKYEVVQGKIVGTDADEMKDGSKNDENANASGGKVSYEDDDETPQVKKEESITIYRQMVSKDVALDEDGKKKINSGTNSGTTNGSLASSGY